MSKKKIGVLFLSISLVLFICYFYQNRSNNNNSIELKKYLYKKDISLDKSPLDNYKKKIVIDQTDNDLKTNYIDLVNKIKEIYTNINFDEELIRHIEALYEKDKNFSNLMIDILTDNKLAKELHGDDQSYGRVIAIKGLKIIADKFDKKPLLKTIGLLTEQYSLGKLNYNGSIADLEDLIMSYCEVTEKNDLINNLRSHLENMGFDNFKTDKNLAKLYRKMFFLNLNKYFENEDELLNTLNNFFKVR